MSARSVSAIAVVVAVAAVASSAVAHPAAGEPDARPAPAESTPATDPRDAGGYDVPPEPPSTAWLWTKRVVLAPARLAVIAVLAPIRGGIWAYDEYDLKARAKQIFFNEDGTVGLFPLASIDTGFGTSLGARFVHRDVFGNDERLRLDARYGGRFRQTYRVAASTGRLLGDRTRVELDSVYGRAPQDRFFGIGNGDIEAAPAMSSIDAQVDDTAVATRFRADALDTSVTAVVQLSHDWKLRAGLGFRYRDFDPRNANDQLDAPVDSVYDTARLVGYDEGLATSYGVLAATFDSSRRKTRWHSGAVPSGGWTANLSGRYAVGAGDDPSNYARVQLDVERYIDLYGGDRVLTLRLGAAGVAGELVDVPFVDVPELGGDRLRGYVSGRFRDRYAAIATAQYTYPIIPPLAGYAFVDAGRVGRSPGDFADGEYRMGFGGGLQVQSRKSLLALVSLSTSIDGGVLFSLRFDPVFYARPHD